MDLRCGQRVVNEAEPALGLGQVKEVDRRRVVVAFPAVDESRVYSRNEAPLRRLVLSPGQTACARDGRKFLVESLAVEGHLVVYRGQGTSLSETELADDPPAMGAIDHLLACQLAPDTDFELRRRAWELRARILGSSLRGLIGPRVDLLSHQLYVASKVTAMARPRVLLADEVGLGKTIEAGLIFSALAATGRAKSVLALVPEPLIHQWLAEFYRRFNLLFELWDPEQPDQQRVLCPAVSLEELPERQWDLVIVDEAHHLMHEQALVELSQRTRGLLLLTATPSRSGSASLFGLLHLVDPERFADQSIFEREHADLRRVAELAGQVEEAGLQQAGSQLVELFPRDRQLAELVAQGDARAVLEALTDRHGTGRVLVRNRRPRLGHLFPGRRLEAVKTQDSFAWLCSFLLGHERKVLLIVNSAEAVGQLYQRLREQLPTTLATFHEHMSLLERDRQAAYFAEPNGAQILLASEIGSEGRNFQFASDLVLYDLPLHPDLLEQRIGRLDRIGQTRVVTIHVPYQDERLLRWHRDGLGSFQAAVAGGDRLVRRFGAQLQEVSEAEFEPWLSEVRQAAQAEAQRARQSEDVLIDRNSFREEQGGQLVEAVAEAGQDPMVVEVVPDLLERFGVVMEELEQGLFSIRPGEMMFVDSLPGLPPEGVLGTFDRARALVREDLEFLSREHPIVAGGLELLLDQPESRAMASRWRGAPETTVLVQFLFVVEAVGPSWLELERYLPPTVSLVSFDMQTRPRPELEIELESARTERLAPEVAANLVGRLGPVLDQLSGKAQQAAVDRARPGLEAGLARARRLLAAELARLQALAEVNPGVGPAELEAMSERGRETLARLGAAGPRLDAVRLVLLQQ
ncbi:MAG: SNF2-related protein [Vulcanimicrobiota bacterium]